MKDKTQEVKAQAEKLERYINRHVTRSLKIGEALGQPGCKMLNDLLEKVSKL